MTALEELRKWVLQQAINSLCFAEVQRRDAMRDVLRKLDEIQGRCPKCHDTGRMEWEEYGLIKRMPCDCGAEE